LQESENEQDNTEYTHLLQQNNNTNGYLSNSYDDYEHKTNDIENHYTTNTYDNHTNIDSSQAVTHDNYKLYNATHENTTDRLLNTDDITYDIADDTYTSDPRDIAINTSVHDINAEVDEEDVTDDEAWMPEVVGGMQKELSLAEELAQSMHEEMMRSQHSEGQGQLILIKIL
jgi:hypothetical protein